MGPLPDPNTQQYQSAPIHTWRTIPLIHDSNRTAVTSGPQDSGEENTESAGSNGDDDDTLPVRAVRPAERRAQPAAPYREPAYREHVSGIHAPHPADAPYFRPAYNPYTQQSAQAIPDNGQNRQNGQSGYASYPAYRQNSSYSPNSSYIPNYAYPGYPAYPYPYPYYPYYQPPAQPKRDRYLLAMAICSFIGSILAFLGGGVCLLLVMLVTLLPNMSALTTDQRFGGAVEFVALALVGLLGGGFGLFHSIRSLFLKKPSRDFKLPWFWTFLVLYLGVLVVEGVLRSEGNAVADTSLAVLLILLAGVLPALAALALGVRRVHTRDGSWATSWRRLSMALLSGSTLAIVLAGILEFLLIAFATTLLRTKGFSITSLDQPAPQDPRTIGLAFIILSVIAPLVEEAIKPLAVVVMIGRMRSAAEAFVLGLACGIGFDLIETAGYIAMGYKDWFDVAVQRSTAGLLHGFGAAMVALGWYYLTHPQSHKHRFLLAVGCWIYAVVQHAIWNGASVLLLLPAPIGPFLNNGTVNIGTFSFQSFLLIYIVISLLMLAFFLYVTGKVRIEKAKPC